jgi:hypothetical protein
MQVVHIIRDGRLAERLADDGMYVLFTNVCDSPYSSGSSLGQWLSDACWPRLAEGGVVCHNPQLLSVYNTVVHMYTY